MQGMPFRIELNEQLLQTLGMKLGIKHLFIQRRVDGALAGELFQILQRPKGSVALIPVQIDLIDFYSRLGFPPLWIRSISCFMHRSRQQTKPWPGKGHPTHSGFSVHTGFSGGSLALPESS